MRKFQLLIVCIILGAFLTQGFQCASPNMTSAREAKTRKDYGKSVDNYEKEIKANPANAEAFYELAEVLMLQANETRDFSFLNKALDRVLEGKKVLKDTKNNDKYFNIEYNIWITCYNAGIQMINQLGDNSLPLDTRKQLTTMVEYILSKAIEVRPEIPDTYYMLGMAYVALEKQDKAIESYKKHNDIYEKEFALAKEKGIFHNMDRDAAIAKLGTPKAVTPLTALLNWQKQNDPKAPNDTVIYYTYNINNQELTLWAKADEAAGKAFVTGWKFDAPAYTKRALFDININPTIQLASILYSEKKYDEAVKYVDLLKILDPKNEAANQFLLQIYEAQGKPEKALESVAELIKADPNDASFRGQYGDILLRLKRYDDAIKAYEEALRLDAEFHEVKRVLGSAYKNKAVEFQKIEIEKFDKDPKYKINDNAYLPFLNKSLAYFEELAKLEEYKNDFKLMFELADIYVVNNTTDKLNRTISKLEMLEPIVDKEDLEMYYLNLLRLYDNTNNQTKLDEINKKIQDLPK